jgi:hypothetical protein
MLTVGFEEIFNEEGTFSESLKICDSVRGRGSGGNGN